MLAWLERPWPCELKGNAHCVAMEDPHIRCSGVGSKIPVYKDDNADNTLGLGLATSFY